MAEAWKVLFARALAQLKEGRVAGSDWIFGGGTVLTHRFNHRESKDIDIFFHSPQFLSFISPRVNDGVEADLLNYIEQAHHTRLQFKEGEVDFIVGAQISEMKPTVIKVLDAFVNVEHPVEVVAKKIYYRAEEIKPRDLFDLAVVFNAEQETMLQNSKAFAGKLTVFAERLAALKRSGELESRLAQLAILPDGEKIRGQEVRLCEEFIQAVGERLGMNDYQSFINAFLY